MTVRHNGKTYHTYQTWKEDWTPEYFRKVRELNPKGKMVLIDDEKGERWLVPIQEVELVN